MFHIKIGNSAEDDVVITTVENRVQVAIDVCKHAVEERRSIR